MYQQENYNNYDSPNEKIKDLLVIALEDELYDKNFYKQLAKIINNKEDSEIVMQISMDEKKHYNYLCKLYKKITDYMPSLDDIDIYKKVENKINKIDKGKEYDLTKTFASAIFSELEAVEFYRRLMFMFLDLEVRDMIYEIITDEQAHATKFNYLYSKYKSI